MFLDPFRGQQTSWRDGRAVWETLAPLRYRDQVLGVLVVPAEFVTDMASVPRAPFTFWIAGGRGTRSAVIHDFLYVFGYAPREGGGRAYMNRADADALFHRSLLADPISGASGWIAWAMYLAVRFGGRGIWRDDARKASLNPIWAATGVDLPITSDRS